jgi:hypothetical protein
VVDEAAGEKEGSSGNGGEVDWIFGFVAEPVMSGDVLPLLVESVFIDFLLDFGGEVEEVV